MLVPLTLVILQAPVGFRPVKHFREALDAMPPLKEWQVSISGGELSVESRESWLKRWREGKNPKRPANALEITLGNATAFWSPGEGAKVDDGLIQGFSAGEFGGGLYWFSKGGKHLQKINGSNTDVVEAFSSGVYAVQSLAHLMFWYSRLVRVERGSSGWKSSTITDLHVTPVAVVRDRSRFIYATDEYVSTLETDGRQREVFRWLFNFRPGTMVRLDNGDLWLGGERTILLLHPKPDGSYTEQWYVPLK